MRDLELNLVRAIWLGIFAAFFYWGRDYAPSTKIQNAPQVASVAHLSE